MARKVAGIGIVKIKIGDGSTKILSNVRHVPELKRNLISFGMLDQAGFTIKSEGGILKVYKGTSQILQGIGSNGLYKLQGKIITNSASLISVTNDISTKIWHCRLAHVSERGLEELYKQGLMGNGNFEKLEFCEFCLYGKQKREKSNTSTHTTKAMLDYVHSDIWRPARVPSRGGARFFISFIDDWSRKVWVYLLKHKNQAFKSFKQWKSLMEKQRGKQIKVLRTNNGLEYLSNEFTEFCKDIGIARHKTVRLTPPTKWSG